METLYGIGCPIVGMIPYGRLTWAGSRALEWNLAADDLLWVQFAQLIGFPSGIRQVSSM